MRTCLLAACAVAFVALPAKRVTAQAPDLRKRIYASLSEIRSPKTTLARRDELVRELLSWGTEAAIPVYNQCVQSLKKHAGRWHSARNRYLSSFEKVASKAVRKRLTKSARARVEALREQQLRLSRTRGLTKARIQSEADVWQRELAKLLEIDSAAVHSSDAKLAKMSRTLELDLERLVALREDIDRAKVVLEDDERGKRHLARQKKPIEDPHAFRSDLRQARMLLCVLATPMREQHRKIFRENHALRGELEATVFEGVVTHNRIRVRSGLAPLRIDLKLCRASQGHSKDMVEHRFFSHTSPLPGKTSVGDRARLAGTTGGGENIAGGQSRGVGAIRAWWYSPGHHRNLMGGYGRVGLGRHRRTWTQMFGR